MVKQKEKKLFYIQLFDNFFQTEDIISIKESALDENINPNDAIIIYQKLILTSIKNNGLIQCSVVSPQIIKNKIGYESNLSRNEDIKTIEQVILILEKLGLIVIADNALYLTKAIQYTLTKQEDSERRRLERLRNTSLINEMQLKALNTLTDEDKKNFEFEKCIDRTIAGLIYCGYITQNEKEKFIDVIYDLDCFSTQEIDEAMKLFIKRSLDTDYSKVVNKEQYLNKTLTNIIQNEIQTELYEFDSTFELLLNKGFINKLSDTRQIKGIIKNYVNKGFTNKEINETLISIINKITPLDNESIISLASYLSKELERLLINNGGDKHEK